MEGSATSQEDQSQKDISHMPHGLSTANVKGIKDPEVHNTGDGDSLLDKHDYKDENLVPEVVESTSCEVDEQNEDQADFKQAIKENKDPEVHSTLSNKVEEQDENYSIPEVVEGKSGEANKQNADHEEIQNENSAPSQSLLEFVEIATQSATTGNADEKRTENSSMAEAPLISEATVHSITPGSDAGSVTEPPADMSEAQQDSVSLDVSLANPAVQSPEISDNSAVEVAADPASTANSESSETLTDSTSVSTVLLKADAASSSAPSPQATSPFHELDASVDSAEDQPKSFQEMAVSSEISAPISPVPDRKSGPNNLEVTQNVNQVLPGETSTSHAPMTPPGYVVLESHTSDGSSEAPEIVQWSTPSASQDEDPPIHCVKWMTWKGLETPVVTQNVNGPCPLLAIANVLLLKRQIELPPKADIVTSARLLELIGNTILENVPKNITETDKINYEQNVSDVLGILPKLQSGIDVNVKFTGVSELEYTPELALFDLLHIPLYHGWIVDGSNSQEAEAVGNLSYNQLVERIIAAKSAEDQDQFLKAAVAESFLERTASQLTYEGLAELASTLEDDEIAVFFRNNHFSTLYKTGDQLFTLVTDQGLLQEEKIVWETLQDIDGSGQFVDSEFKVDGKTLAKFTKDDQIGHDFEMAARLQREADELQEATRYVSGNGQPLNDEELARQLQEEEDKRAQPVSSGGSVSPTREEAPRVEPPKKEEKKSGCIVM